MCSTTLFMEGYRAQNCHGVLRPASLIAQLPMITESFQPGMQQCAAEFFLDFTRALDITSLDYCDKGIVPSHCDTSFLNSFQFSLRSEVKCLLCGGISKSTTNETLLPLPVKKVKCFESVLLQFIIHAFNWSILSYWLLLVLSC